MSLTKNENEQVGENKPPLQLKKRARRTTRAHADKDGYFSSSVNILAGLEDDVVDWSEDEKARKQRLNIETVENQETSDLSQRDPQDQVAFSSIPTDKFYLEMEKKFAIQNKGLFEKKLEERVKQLREAEMKRKFKDELKFQISTPRIALKTHKFMRALFLLIQGVNIGFLVWQSVIAYTVDVDSFILPFNSSDVPKELPYFYVFRDLIMPIHCLSYFFLAICIVDCLDR